MCVTEIEELNAEAVKNEKLIQETEDAFVTISQEEASLEDCLLINEVISQGLSRKFEDVQVEAQAEYSAGLVHLTSHFVKIRRMKEENGSLAKQIEGFGVIDYYDHFFDESEYDSDP